MTSLGLCFTATLTKLAGSIDDTVWLLPFLCGSQQTKIKHSAVYIILFLCEACFCKGVTSILATIGALVLPESAVNRGWEVTSVMQMMSGTLLAAYGIKLKLEG